jgi:predicted oxidoreductase
VPDCPFASLQIQSQELGCPSTEAARASDSSRSQFHVQIQTWRPFGPGFARFSPSTTTERSVSRPLPVVATAMPAPSVVDVALCWLTGPDVPELSTRTETCVF